MPDSLNSTNPYEGPSRTFDNNPDSNEPAEGELSVDARENLLFTSRIIRAVALFVAINGLAAAYYVFSVFRWGGFTFGTLDWTYFHWLMLFRLLFSLASGLLVVMMWKYANCLKQLSVLGISQLESSIERQGLAWLTGGLLALLIIAEMGLNAVFFSII